MSIVDNLGFNWLTIYQFLIGCTTLIYFSFDKLKNDGWDKAYLFFNSNLLNFIKWGKEQNILLLMNKIRIYVFYIFFISLAFLFLIGQFPILMFLSNIIVYIFTFSFFTIFSFYSILRFKEESIWLLKTLLIIISIFTILMSLGIYSNGKETLSILKELSQNQFHISLDQFYLISFTALISSSILLFIFIYILYWCLIGFIPTVIFLFLFTLTKSSYIIEKIISFKKIATLLVILNIIGLFLSLFYKPV